MGRLWPDPRGDRSIEKKQSDTHVGLLRGLERMVASSSGLSYQLLKLEPPSWLRLRWI